MMSGSVPARYNHLFGPSISTSHRDVTEDKYRELRRPRKVTFFCNGDRYFKGKKLLITPHRYLTFNDLLNDLTGKLPSGVPLPYGVRQIYTPISGRRIKDIEELQDGQSYICAGFEPFKPIQYGGEILDRWSVEEALSSLDRRQQCQQRLVKFLSDLQELYKRHNYPTIRAGRPVQYDFQHSLSPNFSNLRVGYGSGFGGYGGFHPGRHLRQTYPRGRYQAGGMGPSVYQSHLHMSGEIPMKPKVITVVRNGKKPRNNIKVLLNRRNLQSFEQLISDISEAFGPKWKNNKVRNLFTTKGKSVKGVSDFFRNEDLFIAVGNEALTNGDVQDILEELYPEGTDTQHLMKEWEKNKKKNKPMYMYTYGDKENDSKDESKRDSGFEDTGSSVDPKPDKDEIIYEGHSPRSWRSRSRRPPYAQYPDDDDWMMRMERERARAAERERELARRKMQKKLEAERQALEDEKRKRGLVPQKDSDKLKKRQQEKMKERKRKEAEMQRAKEEEEKAKQEEEEKAVRVAAKNIGKRKDDTEVEKVEIIITKGPNQPMRKDPEKDKQKDKKGKEENKNKNINKAQLDNDENANKIKNKDGVDENSNKKDDNANKTNKDDDNKIKDTKDKDQKKRTKRSKLDRQISNADQVLDKYEPGKTLGDGNFAIVRQAKMKNSPNEYAMKVIDKSKLKGKEYMVENEIEIMRLCNHPTIVKLYEEYETKDEIYLIMELIKGGDLFDAITQSVKFAEPESASMVTDLTNALFYLHSRNIVHRDLKPENLLVHRNKDNSITLKLADFGLAMEVTEPIFTVCGTPTYVAPEILSEIGYGLEIDIWAVGVITYILLCGFPPFRSPDRNQTELFEYIKAGEYEFLRPYWDNISDSAKDLIEHLLIVDKKKRYTAIDVLCHPWIITCGGANKPPDNMVDHRKNLRKELESQAKVNLESFRNAKNIQ